MAKEKDYVLGTHDDEIARLALQHRVWRPRALDAWKRAGFTVGQTLLDIGCGPGYASTDLAEIVGPAGRIVAVDRSRRFLDTLEARRETLGLDNIAVSEQDLDHAEIPAVDGAWGRWVFAFIRDPRGLLERVAGAIRPGGSLVVHEYFDYATWGTSPRCPEIDAFVQVVVKSWRAQGGEPDIGLDLPVWLAELGFEIRILNPIIEIVTASSYMWQWPKSFIAVGPRRLVELGQFTAQEATALAEAFARIESNPRAFMITPAVLEIIAVRR